MLNYVGALVINYLIFDSQSYWRDTSSPTAKVFPQGKPLPEARMEVLAGAYDVPEQVVLEAVSTSTGDSWITRNWGFFDRVAAAYDSTGTPVKDRPWSKDLWDIVAAARDCDVQVPLAGLLSQHLADQVEAHARKGSGR